MRDCTDDKRTPTARITGNKGRLVRQKPPLKLKDIWAIRIRVQLARRTREYARIVKSWSLTRGVCWRGSVLGLAKPLGDSVEPLIPVVET